MDERTVKVVDLWVDPHLPKENLHGEKRKGTHVYIILNKVLHHFHYNLTFDVTFEHSL